MKAPFWILALASVLITACATPGSDGDNDSDLIRVHPGRAEGGVDAIVQGTIEVDLELGCVWLSSPDGARHPIVWPEGTSMQEDPFAIVLRDGQVVTDGDMVSGGGGYAPALGAAAAMQPFPEACVQDGDAAVFNSDSDLQVVEGGGQEAASTLIGRFSVPESIGLELIAVNPNRRTVAVADFVNGTVHLYEPSDYEGPVDSIDGASGGGGFIHLWAQGSVYSYPGRLTEQPLVYQPENLREIEGVAPVLEVLPAPDGEHTWLVQDGAGVGPTLIELVNLVEVQVARLFSVEVEGSWQPHGTTTDGLVLVSNEGPPRTLLVAMDGSVGDSVAGKPLSVGWSGALILEDGALHFTGPDLTEPVEVVPPSEGQWASLAGPVIPADAPPIRTGGGAHLAAIVEGSAADSWSLVFVENDGATRVIDQFEIDRGVATFSRADDWVVVVGSGGVTLISDRGDRVSLGEILPPEHWVLAAG